MGQKPRRLGMLTFFKQALGQVLCLQPLQACAQPQAQPDPCGEGQKPPLVDPGLHRILQLHQDVTIIADEEALSKCPR